MKRPMKMFAAERPANGWSADILVRSSVHPTARVQMWHPQPFDSCCGQECPRSGKNVFTNQGLIEI